GHEFISNGLYRLLKRDESLPLSYRDILGQLDSRDRKTVMRMVSDSRSSEKELEIKVRDFTGGLRIISCIIENKTGPGGNRETTTGFCRDITDYKSMQERLRIKSHIDSIGTLASGYAHEINNPLNGIMNYAQLIIDENTGMEGLDEYAGEIIREGERISRITGSLIARSSQMSESIQNCMIEKAIKRALDNLHGLIEESGIVINVVGNDIEHITKGYCSGLANVFIEVLKNSIRALNEKYQGSDYNGTITIETSMADTESGRKIRLSISDDGTGISDKDLERVFDPFFSTYPKDMAMGMGLTNVYTTIQRNNGDVWLRSEYGKYTEVIIQLPYEPSGS
ncbi:MAG TPA: HAMP domain-containing sensor histidine kinase, partial [Clostridia bacterium]|nr:HAMP domain-containing sensor histidine kinase [Clostridia bacterium]